MSDPVSPRTIDLCRTRRPLRATGTQSCRAQSGQNIVEVGAIAGFDHHLKESRLGWQIGKRPLVRYFNNVGPRLGKQGGNRRQLTWPVNDVDGKLGQPSL